MKKIGDSASEVVQKYDIGTRIVILKKKSPTQWGKPARGSSANNFDAKEC